MLWYGGYILSEIHDKQRMDALLDGANAYVKRTAQERADKTAEIAKQHTEYFDKLSLGSGAVLAAIVSFVGGKKDLHPAWLLRETMIVLTLSVIVVLIRNAIYPYYIGSVYLKRALKAEIDRDSIQADYLAKYPVHDLDSGELIDA